MAATILGGRNVATEQTATADIMLAVTAAGNDAATDGRRAKVLNGDKSATPYLTVQAAANAIPKHLAGKTATVALSGDVFATATFSNIHDGTLYIKGTVATATVTTGSASGTCGTGTSGTSFKKPTASANWTVNDLRNVICKIILSGTTYWRTITSNTVDTAVIETITSLDNTATFEFVNVGTTIGKNASSECLVFEDCSCNILIEAIKPSDTAVTYGIVARRCGRVQAYACDLNIDTVATFYAYRCESVDVTDSRLASAANILLDRCQYAVAIRLTGNNGSVQISHAIYAEIGLDALSVAANAAKFLGCLYATATLNANTCTSSPLVIDACSHFVGGNLTGTNAGTLRGIEILNGGTHTVTGATLAGSGDELLIDDVSTTYSNLATLGIVYNAGTYVVWGTGASQSLRGLSIPNGTVTFGGQFQTYGHWYQLGNADPSISAFTAGGQASATEIGYQSAIVTGFTGAAANGASIKIRAGIGAGGASGRVINSTTNVVNFFPISGGSINSMNLNAYIEMPAKSWALWRSTSASNLEVIIIDPSSDDTLNLYNQTSFGGF